MERVNNFHFYELGEKLNCIKQLSRKVKLREIVLPIFQAQITLRYFLENRVIPLHVSRSCGQELFRKLADLASISEELPSEEDLEKELDWEVHFLIEETKKFETVLSAELQTLDTYFVSQKAAYSTKDLIENADLILTNNVRTNVPALTIEELKRAGRCLAFDCPTAAGFHIIRATEAVLRDYYAIIVKAQPKPQTRNWGAYLKILGRNGGDQKVLGILDQMRELHRNPLIHPEESLNMDEAITLLGVANGAIAAMSLDIAKRKNPPQIGAAALGSAHP